jgi:DNA-binding CsgD family transcriptional regulator
MGYLERFQYRERIRKRLSKEEINSLLTRRQKEVLKLAAMGLSNIKIGDRSGTTFHNINSIFKNRKSQRGIFSRLRAHSRREAVVKTISLGILNPEKLVNDEEINRCQSLSEREIEVLNHLTDPFLPSYG